MPLRYKVLIVLLLVALGPLLALRLRSGMVMRDVAARLAGHVGAHLVDVEKAQMQKLVEDHATLYLAKREALVLALRLQAREVEGAFQGADPAGFDPSGAFIARRGRHGPAGQGMGHGSGYFRQGPDDQRAPLPVDFDNQTFLLAPGLSTEAAADDLARLGTLTPVYKSIAGFLRDISPVQLTSLQNGATGVYPAHGGFPRGFDSRQSPWHAEALSRDRAVGAAPFVEPSTGRVMIGVSMPVSGRDGRPIGVTAILAPLEDVLASLTPGGHLHGEVRTMVGRVTGEGESRGLYVQAGRQPRGDGSAWSAYARPGRFESADVEALKAIMDDIAAGKNGAREITYEGREWLAAWAVLDDERALLQLAPLREVLAASREVAAEVESGITRQFRESGQLAVLMVGLIVVVSFFASRAVTGPLKTLTAAARRLAQGDFSARVPAGGRDEIGEVGRVFNAIVPELEDNVRMRSSLALAMEVQMSLLPHEPPRVNGLDMAALSLYCDETGGDYYDYFHFEDGPKAGRLGVAVGDVSGHGIGAALLMTTARALVRPRAHGPGAPSDIMADVNRELCRDTYGTGRFMTLMYLEIDPAARSLAWARAGHDPALLYDPGADVFIELAGRGLTLGVMDDARYELGELAHAPPGATLFIGSDGMFEARDETGGMYGRERPREVLKRCCRQSAHDIQEALLADLDAFRGARPLEDDVTVMVIRFDP